MTAVSRVTRALSGLAAAAASPSAALLIGAALLVCAPRPAAAANEAHPRTPVLWPQTCGEVVVRSENPVLHLDYSIPTQDTQLEPDELADSRTHQFIALCRQHPASELLPPWITRDDVERSVAANIIEADSDVTARELLDESSVWAGCFTRITADDARVPIDFASAAAGVEWDTSALPVGVWALSGYTFEPPFNLWSDRPGFVKVVDTRDDPDQDLPALGLVNREQSELEVGAMLELEACADMLGPAALVFEWAAFAPSLEWRALATLTLDEDGAFAPQLRAPADAAGSDILLRGRLIDARGREYVAHAPARVSVAPCPPSGCPEPGDDTGDMGANPVSPSGCSLQAEPAPKPANPLLLLVFVLLWHPGWKHRDRHAWSKP